MKSLLHPRKNDINGHMCVDIIEIVDPCIPTSHANIETEEKVSSKKKI